MTVLWAFDDFSRVLKPVGKRGAVTADVCLGLRDFGMRHMCFESGDTVGFHEGAPCWATTWRSEMDPIHGKEPKSDRKIRVLGEKQARFVGAIKAR